ncbi:putative DEAD box RNA helicase [Trypanosoma rangeli]|uniref:RNA helicase n=1 Tax=Trypanosoma rangeli TaxID=5698 RepID=A0A422N502_TRYRA|nr:putative DEAD box RNA helicase [Trypanosoma rangeli]RNF00530.1 putative DEAD box RNA helicase [Trypanosoma rangeli]|eukprot:RNF00530.1 putative DEAD box RNA helicase [Trypanosoma rangeli]
MEDNYSPFTGYQTLRRQQGSYSNNDSATGRGGRRSDLDAPAAKMKPVDWANVKLMPSNWKVIDAKAIHRASNAKTAVVPVKELTEDESKEWRETHTISVFGEGCPPPVTTFDQLSSLVPAYLQKKLTAQGFASPTAVQAQAWPILLRGRDMVGVAKTGSGKTLAFMIPALAHIAIQEPLRVGDGPIVVVLAPTRELAQQIEEETKKVLPHDVRCGCVYGGSPKGPQLGILRQGVHVLVATPGRLIDFLQIKRVNLFRVTYLVLDEADRMLDMGFEPQVRAVCGQMRPDRQTLMFSATWPKEIQRLAAEFQKDWIRINVGSTELLANKDVTQHFILTQEYAKTDELKKLMADHRNQRVLVFCKTKRTADDLEWQLKRWGYDAMAIHGDKEQRQREFVLERFKKDPRLCVVATDVAARGLDIKQLETVINYDFPMQIDDYVHRIGRTGRAGAKGEAITLITKREQQITQAVVTELIAIVERAQQQVPDWLREWGEQQPRYQVMKRNRNMMGFGSSRHAPILYNGNRSSFDAAGHAHHNSSAKQQAEGGVFGLTRHSGNGIVPFSSSKIEYKRFDDSSDDDAAQPAKRRLK